MTLGERHSQHFSGVHIRAGASNTPGKGPSIHTGANFSVEKFSLYAQARILSSQTEINFWTSDIDRKHLSKIQTGANFLTKIWLLQGMTGSTLRHPNWGKFSGENLTFTRNDRKHPSTSKLGQIFLTKNLARQSNWTKTFGKAFADLKSRVDTSSQGQTFKPRQILTRQKWRLHTTRPFFQYPQRSYHPQWNLFLSQELQRLHPIFVSPPVELWQDKDGDLTELARHFNILQWNYTPEDIYH